MKKKKTKIILNINLETYNKNSFVPDSLYTAASKLLLFSTKNPDELCKKLQLVFQEKQVANDTSRFDVEIVAIIHKLLEEKCITKTHHKKVFSSNLS